MGVLFRITQQMSPETAFPLVGIMTGVFSFAYLFMVREPKIIKTEDDDDSSDNDMTASMISELEVDDIASEMMNQSFEDENE